MNITSQNQPHITAGFRITWGLSNRLPWLESISPFVELSFLHCILFQLAANHARPPAHMVGIWPKLSQTDCLFCKFGFWMARKAQGRKRGDTESSNDHAQGLLRSLGLPWFLPRKCFISSSILWPHVEKPYLFFVSQLVLEAWKQKEQSCISETEELISSWSGTEEQYRERMQYTGFWSGLPNNSLSTKYCMYKVCSPAGYTTNIPV